MCFVLLYSEDVFNLSRNFKLQKVGNTEWVIENYDFNEMSKSIDELIILNINKNQKPISKKFITNISPLIEKSLMPVGIGGGIKNYETAKFYFDNGADKIIINSNFFQNDTNFIQKIINQYGSQSVVASIDYKKQGLKNAEVYIDNGDKKLGISLFDAIRKIEVLGAGEILLTSVDREGTGKGLDVELLREVRNSISISIIIHGGVGSFEDLYDAFNNHQADAVCVASLFHYDAC